MKIFRKFSLRLIQKYFNENIKFDFIYEEIDEFLDSNKINKVVEPITKFDRNVKAKISFTTEAHKNFEKLKNDVNKLQEKLNKDILDVSKLKLILNKLIQSCQNYQVVEH